MATVEYNAKAFVISETSHFVVLLWVSQEDVSRIKQYLQLNKCKLLLKQLHELKVWRKKKFRLYEQIYIYKNKKKDACDFMFVGNG